MISSPNPSMLLALLISGGKLMFTIRMAWFEGELVFFFLYIVYFTFLLHFLHTHLSHFASSVILDCICLIMFITVVG
jgi:hypothetical protein